MTKSTVASKWGVELKGTLIEKNSDTLCIVLPGIAYLIDRSYLDYSKQMASELGFDVLSLEYGFQINRTTFDVPTEFDIMANETIKTIDISINKDYKNIIIIGKSIGTCVQNVLNAHFKNKKIKNIYISPIDKTAENGVHENSLVITGSADPLLSSENLEKIKATSGVKLINIENANHALDIPGDVLKTVQVLLDIIKAEKEFLL